MQFFGFNLSLSLSECFSIFFYTDFNSEPKQFNNYVVL